MSGERRTLQNYAYWSSRKTHNKLRQCARCTECDNRGATLKHPTWVGNGIGFMPFPIEESSA